VTTVAKSEPSVGELLGALARDTGVLVRQEVQLASSEMATKTSGAARAVSVIAAGGALIHAGFMALIFALFIGLADIVPIWLSALVAGAVVVAAGFAVAQRGLRALKHIDPVPRQAMKTLKVDAVWAKEQLP
jgi:hypothetical protein